VVRHAIAGLADARAIDPELMADVSLAVSEACANVVQHAYPDGAGLLEVSASTGGDELAIVVRDHGRGILPNPDSPGLGVGLPLIAALTDNVELTSAPTGATEVRMRFELDAPRRDAATWAG
jgi:anti-sigma regulatory factor (Ser/Thr protein kinase)